MGLLSFFNKILGKGTPEVQKNQVLTQQQKPVSQQSRIISYEQCDSEMNMKKPDGTQVHTRKSLKKSVALISLNEENCFLKAVLDFLCTNAIYNGMDPMFVELHQVSSRFYVGIKPSNGQWHVYSCPLSYMKDPNKGICPLEKSSSYDHTEINVEWLPRIDSLEMLKAHVEAHYMVLETGLRVDASSLEKVSHYRIASSMLM